MNFFEFVYSRKEQLLRLIFEHIQIAIIALLFSIFIGVSLGLIISRYKALAKPIVALANVIQAIPSLALLGFIIPLVGVSEVTAIILVVLYAILPVLKNTYTGITNISPDLIEAATGLGMTKIQVLLKVQMPLAMPVIMAGIRIAAVNSVGLVTIASYAGGKGLGFMVYSGINTVDVQMILSGAIPAAILALLMDFVISKIENIVTPVGIRPRKK